LRWSILIAAVCLVAGVGLIGCGKGKSPGSGGKTVVLYTSVDQQFAEKIASRFTKKTGIKVQCRFDTEATKTLGLVQRLRSESKHPQADVFWSSEIFETIRLANEGVLASYRSSALANWPEDLCDARGRWYAFALRARVLAYNTRRVKADEAPKSIEDLLGERWKGRVVMARPQFGTTRGHVAAMWVHYGPQRAKHIFRGLKANGVRLVNGNSTAVRMVAEGRADVCLTDTDDVWVAQRNGWPVELVYPRHGEAGTVLIPNSVALVRGGPHPVSAATLIDFLLSPEVEEMLARSDSHNIPIRAELTREFPQYAVRDAMAVDYAKVAEATKDAIRAVTAIFER